MRFTQNRSASLQRVHKKKTTKTEGEVPSRGKNLVQATADAKVLNFASNLAALATFIVSGKVVWLVGGVMIAGTVAGAYLGSLVVLNIGAKVIRPAIVIMSLAMLCTYIWQRLEFGL